MASILDKNFSIYTVPAAWFIAFGPHLYARKLSGTAFDIRSPRSLSSNLGETQTLTQDTKDRIVRAEGAQTNGFENLGLYASAIVAANVAGLPAKTLNALSGGYLLSRIVYNWVYINNTTVQVANARSVVYLSGVGIVFTLLVKAGNVLREKGIIFSL